jgi:hypothetical protein
MTGSTITLQPGRQGAFGLGAYYRAVESGLSDEQIKALLPDSGLEVGPRVQRALGVDARGRNLNPEA